MEDIIFHTNVLLSRVVLQLSRCCVLRNKRFGKVGILCPLSPQEHYNAANTWLLLLKFLNKICF